MGGNVGVIIKKLNGEQVGMSRWTNIMPRFFKDINLYLGNTEQWYQEFSEQWLEMKQDYENNKHTGNFQHNMTPVYFPHNHCVPDEYGIIAVDFNNKKIYSSQDYCNIGSLAFHHVWDMFNNNKKIKENIIALKQYFDNGFLKKVQYYNPEKKDVEVMDISDLSFDEIIYLVAETADARLEKYSLEKFQHIKKDIGTFYSTVFLLNTEWQFVVYNDRSIGVLKVKKEMDKDGFVFSDQDNKQWKQYVSYQWNYISEEELEEYENYEEFKVLYKEVFNEEFIHKYED